jgi:phosphate starvation-inducible protein PhoH and related proteins
VPTTRYRTTRDRKRETRRQLEDGGWKETNIEKYLETIPETEEEVELWVGDDGLARRVVTTSTTEFPQAGVTQRAVTTTEYFGLRRRHSDRAASGGGGDRVGGVAAAAGAAAGGAPDPGRGRNRHAPRGVRAERHAVLPTLSRVQETLSVPNEVAAELAGVGDGVLDALRARLSCTLRLRGNQLTIEGEDDSVAAARAVVDELVELVEGGHEIGPDTVGAVVAALDQAEDIREVFDDVVWRHRGKKIAPKTVTQKRYVDSIRDCTVTFGIGPAGTGKTYLAIALAVAALTEKQVGRIILTRPAIEAGERLGFLPGDMLAKVDPYMRPLFDALYDMMDPDRLSAYMERGTVEVAPLAFMRGRTLNDSFIILDEAQNTSPEQMQMFLTRLGFGSKVVVTGDVTQVDLPRDQASGLIQVRDILSSIDGIGFVEFTHQDVVRHKLVQRIVEAYKLHAEETGTARKR